MSKRTMLLTAATLLSSLVLFTPEAHAGTESEEAFQKRMETATDRERAIEEFIGRDVRPRPGPMDNPAVAKCVMKKLDQMQTPAAARLLVKACATLHK